MNNKVLITDDEKAVRTILKKSIERIHGYEVVGEAENGNEALRLVESLKPDIVFLDVEMPAMGGIECAKRIADINPKIYIIFATAHQEYMPEAFEVYAFDYLVKPFKIERLRKTLERVNMVSRSIVNNMEIKNPLLSGSVKRLVIKNREGTSYIDTEDIIVIQRENKSTAIYTINDKYITSESLTDLGQRLDSRIFFRSHKSYVINLTKIHKIYPYGRWTYIIKFRDTNLDALITHEKNEELQKMF